MFSSQTLRQPNVRSRILDGLIFRLFTRPVTICKMLDVSHPGILPRRFSCSPVANKQGGIGQLSTPKSLGGHKVTCRFT